MRETNKFYDIAFKIDRLLKDCSPEKMQKIESYFAYKGIKNYFFRKLSTVPNPFPWIDILKKKGYFNPENNPKPQEIPDQPGYFTIPHWSVLDYLEHVANKNAEEPSEEITNTLIEIVNSIINYRDENGERVDNYRTDWFMLKIISTFPIEKIKDQHIEFIRDALNSRWNSALVAGEIGKTLLPKLIKHKSKTLLLKLLDVMFDYSVMDETKDKKYKPIMDEFWLSDALKKHKLEIIKICGIEAAEIALRKIKSIIQISDAYFYITWIPAIEDHPQNRHTDKYECQLVHFVRDTFEQLEARQIREIIKNLLSEEHPIFKRIAIYTINSHFAELNDLFWMWDGNPLDEPMLKHELFELFKSNCTSFDDKQIKQVLEWIEKKKYLIPEDIKDDEEKKDKYLAYKKREWLLALLDSKNPDVIKAYEGYKKLNPAKIAHPGFDFWMESWVGEISPIKVEELCAKTNHEIAEYLNTFKEVAAGWKTPTKEGLADTFRKCVVNNPEKFSIELEPFLNVQRMYQHSLLWGLLEAWRNNKSFEWDELFKFILRIIESDEFWGEEYDEDRYNYRDAIVSQIAELINNGTKDDNHAFNPELLPVAEKILLILLQKAESSLPAMSDLITSVLNSTKGKIFVAMVNYSLRYARLYKTEEIKRWVEPIKAEFDKRLDRTYDPSIEFSVVIGEYLPNLYYLDKEWVIDNISRIFPENDEVHWKAAFAGYLFYASTIYEEIYSLLRKNKHYDRAIDTDFENEHIEERLVQHICVAYLQGWETLDDENSLLVKLIDKRNTDQLSEIVSFFWMLRDRSINKSKIKPLWHVLFKIVSENIDKSEYQNIISDLSKWLSLIDEIDEEIFEWLKLSARYVEINHNTSIFVEYLAKHVEKGPEKVGKLYLEMLDSGIYPDYQDDEIKYIVETLYKKGQKEIADRICNKYGDEGYYFDFLRELYEQYKK